MSPHLPGISQKKNPLNIAHLLEKMKQLKNYDFTRKRITLSICNFYKFSLFWHTRLCARKKIDRSLKKRIEPWLILYVFTRLYVYVYICTKHFLGLRISLDALSSEEAVADNAIHGVPWKSRRWKERLESEVGENGWELWKTEREGEDQGGVGRGDSLTQGKEVAHRHAVCHLRATASSNDRSVPLLLREQAQRSRERSRER